MKMAIFFLIFLITVLSASAAYCSSSEETGSTHIADLFSDLESFDVTLFSDNPHDHLVLDVTLLKPVGNNEEVLARQAFPIDGYHANSRVTKVGFWNVRNAERGAYSIRASLIENEKIISEAKYDFTYGDRSVSKLRIGNLMTNSEGINIILSPVEPVLFDIEYMLVDGSDVAYLTERNNVSLTSVPETFSATWGTLLENNREYQGRVKIRVYSPEIETFVSTKSFIARDDAEITDIYKDETGASATVYGRSQVPFEGSLVFNVYELKNDTVKNSSEPVESIHEKVPVLMNGDDETVEVAWKQRLQKGVYRLEIELLGNTSEVVEHRETIIESDLAPNSNMSAAVNSTSGTDASSGKSIPGFSASTLIAGLAAISIVLRKQVEKVRD